MYYIMSNDDKILDVCTIQPDQEQADRAARMFGCDVWVMRGEHTGITAMASSSDTSFADSPEADDNAATKL